MKKRIIAAALAALICLFTVSPALAAERAGGTDLPGAAVEQTILSMLDRCILGGIFGNTKQDVTETASFVCSTEEAYGDANRIVFDTLRVLVNSEDIAQEPYSIEAWKRIVPADHDPVLEIRAEGSAPGRRSIYTYLDGAGNLIGRSDSSVTEGYRIDLTITFHRSEGDFIDRLAALAAEVRAASDTVTGQLAFINDFLIRDFSYDYQSAYLGPFTNSVGDFLNTGKGVCGSYANTVSYLCLLLGIPCIVLQSSAPASAAHAWNCVYVDGAWKELDVTFNETEGRSRAYFLVDSIAGAMHDWQSYDNTEVVRCAKETALDLAARLSGAAPAQPEPVPAQPEPVPAVSDGIRVKCGGSYVAFPDAEPFLDANDRTMVPLRAVADALGLMVEWDGEAREAAFTGGGRTIVFPIGSSVARTDDGPLQMDTEAVIVRDRTYAPVRWLAEYFGRTVGWDGAERTVLID